MAMPDPARVLPSPEPPCADPHAGWCGERGWKTPAYPIRHNATHVSQTEISKQETHNPRARQFDLYE